MSRLDLLDYDALIRIPVMKTRGRRQDSQRSGAGASSFYEVVNGEDFSGAQP